MLSQLFWRNPQAGAMQADCDQCLLCWQAAAEGAEAPVLKK